MVATETQKIQIAGPGPYGFRLFGGDSDPLTVIKLRKQSKAFEAGLKEGDILVGINGVSCQNLSHAAAMNLIDRASSSLDLHVYRGSGEGSSLSTVYQTSELRPLSPSSAPAPRRLGATEAPVQPVNHIDIGPLSSYSKQEHTSVEGDTTRHMTTETKTDDFGGHTITKVTKQEIVQQTQGGQGQQHPQHQTFQVSSKISMSSGGPKAAVWTPNRGSSNGIQHSNHPTDTRENQDPSASKNQSKPVFRVSPNAPQATSKKNKPWIWQPTFVPVIEREPENLDPLENAGTLILTDESENPEMWSTKRTSEGGSADGQEELPLHLQRILTHVVENDPESRRIYYSQKKKKIFADSSFFDDPDHKYPTIEEQIKMARKVALSLTAPTNVTARGQRMFIKRKEKATKWSTDFTGRQFREPRDDESESEIYYNPTPWKPGRPSGRLEAMVASPPAAPQGPPSWMAKRMEVSGPPPSPPPPFNPGSFPARHLASTSFDAHEERSNFLRPSFLNNHKTPQLPTAPQTHFSLAEDLRSMRGKGGKLFAKRRARAVEESAIDEARPPNFAIMQKIRSSYEPTALQLPPTPATKPTLTEVDSAVVVAASASRLKELIEKTKTKMSPWDASVDYSFSGYNTMPSKRTQLTELTPRSVDDFGVRQNPGSQVDFAARSKGSYRPVKFRAPLDIASPVTEATSRRSRAPLASSAVPEQEGESEF